MFNCYYNEKRICSLDVINEFGKENLALTTRWKLAGDANGLHCECCGTPVILKAGTIRLPHFAHKNLTNCLSQEEFAGESNEHKEGKRIFYHYFKNKYGEEADVQVNSKLSNGRRADILVQFQDGNRLAIEIQRLVKRTTDWYSKNNDYKNMQLNVLWVLCGNNAELEHLNTENQSRFFERMILNEANDKLGIYLHVTNKKLTLVRKLFYYDQATGQSKYEKLVVKSYPLDEVTIYPDGKVQSSFDNEFEQCKKQFEQQCVEKEKELAVKKQLELEQQKRMSRGFSNVQFGTGSQGIHEPTLPKGAKNSTYSLERSRGYYEFAIKRAISGDEQYIKKVIGLIYDGSSNFRFVCEIFNKFINDDMYRAEETYKQVLKMSGMSEIRSK
jgi:competence protein CoiA